MAVSCIIEAAVTRCYRDVFFLRGIRCERRGPVDDVAGTLSCGCLFGALSAVLPPSRGMPTRVDSLQITLDRGGPRSPSQAAAARAITRKMLRYRRERSLASREKRKRRERGEEGGWKRGERQIAPRSRPSENSTGRTLL